MAAAVQMINCWTTATDPKQPFAFFGSGKFVVYDVSMYRRPASVALALIVIVTALGILWASNHRENSQESTTTDDRPDTALATSTPITSLQVFRVPNDVSSILK